MLRLRIFTRFDAKSSMYLDICQEDSQRWKEYFNEHMELCSAENWKKMIATPRGSIANRFFSLTIEKEKLWAKAVTFSVMCLEAFIYDYTAHYWQSYAEHLDKLDLVSKWIIIPRFTLGRDFPKSSKAFEYLKKLVKYRNGLIHYKSLPMPPDSKRFQKLEKWSKKEVERDKYMLKLSPYKMVLEIFTELRKLEGDDIATQWWQLEEVDEQKQ